MTRFGYTLMTEQSAPRSLVDQFVRADDVADNIPCGPDLGTIVEAVSSFWEAGFTDVALVQVGDDSTGRFLDEAAGPLLSALREASPDGD